MPKFAKVDNSDYLGMIMEKLDVEQKVAKLIAKHVDQERFEDYERMSAEDLEEQFWRSESDVKTLREEVKKNPKHVEASEVIKTLNSGLRETIAPYKGTQALRLALLELKKAVEK